MAALRRQIPAIRAILSAFENRQSPHLFGSSRSYYSGVSHGISSHGYSQCLPKVDNDVHWMVRRTFALRSVMAMEVPVYQNERRMSTQVKAPPQSRQMGSLKVSLSSPGFVYEPYAPRAPISFWSRWFTRSGWKRTKEDFIIEMKSAYAISKLRKSGYSKNKFYQEALQMYKEINVLLAHGDKTTIRKAVTEKMYSELKNEIKTREARWSKVYWEMVEPVVKIRTMRARLIGVDRSDLNKSFIQLTLEILTKQKFEAYDSKGVKIAGDKNKEVLVRDLWVFEKSLFHKDAFWRLCGRIAPK
ncbi:Probable 39S ribosomal protein L45, mitochondrial [Linum perenne]